jgi:polyisoprenoid-binding protein YceI
MKTFAPRILASCTTFAAALALPLCAATALAQRQTFTANPDASQVAMTLKTNHEIVNGTFHLQSGAIDFDRSSATLSGSVVVSAVGGKTGNDSRDKKMSKDVLQVEKYATVSFAPKSYTGAIALSGDSTIQVTGIFTLIGQPHEVTVPMQIHIEGSACTAKAHLVIPYVQWGLKDPSFMMWKAEKETTIDLTLVGKIS